MFDRNHDAILEHLISIVEKNGFSFPVTLNSNGIIITGNIITFHEYIDLCMRDVSTVIRKTNPTNNRIINTSSDTEGLVFADGNGQSEQNVNFFDNAIENISIADTHHIHLKDITIFSGTTNIKGKYWRGTISSIDGFTIGNANLTSESDSMEMYLEA